MTSDDNSLISSVSFSIADILFLAMVVSTLIYTPQPVTSVSLVNLVVRVLENRGDALDVMSFLHERTSPTTVGSKSTKIACITCFPASAPEKKVSNASSPPQVVLSLKAHIK